VRNKSISRCHWFWLVAFVANLTGQFSLKGVLLDWDKLDWATGASSMTYYATNTVGYSAISGTSIFYADNDYTNGSITITISGTIGTAKDKTVPDGGTDERVLRLDTDFENQNQKMTITVTFNNYTDGVNEVVFNIFDVDISDANDYAFQDRITNLYAQSGGTAIAPVGVIGGTYAVVSGSGTNTLITGTNNAAGANSSDGNVSIDFGTNYLNTFTFSIANGGNAPSNPDAQQIALHDISFKPKVPEVGSGIAAALSCLLVLWTTIRRNKPLPDQCPAGH
jgi:hypothetical protein